LVKPFVDSDPQQTLLNVDVVIRLENLRAMIPPIVELPPLNTLCSPMSLFFQSEIENYNQSIRKLINEIQKALKGDIKLEVIRAMNSDQVPVEWGRIVGDLRHRQTSRFVMALQDRADFYERWLKNGLFGNHVNLEFLRDVRGLMASYIDELSAQRSQTGELGYFVFQVSDGIKEHDPGLILNDAWLVGANFNVKEGLIIEVNPKTPAFVNIQQLVCVPRWRDITSGPPVEHELNYECPFYLRLPGVNGEPLDQENFICYVALNTNVPVSKLTADGVVMICQLPPHFSSETSIV
jgi:hypothetical protein